MTDEIIYFDNNATTKTDERVVAEMLPYFCDKYGNPSSMYNIGQDAAKVIKSSREVMAEFLGASTPDEVYFNSCGSEGASTVIKSVVELNKSKNHLVTTKVEHPCVLNLHKELEKKGYKVTYIDVDNNGDLDLDQLETSIQKDTALVSCMWANNETGAIFPAQKIAKAVKEKNPDTKVFVDAVQVAGKMPINVKDTAIDFLIVSGHKFHAPKGIGALYVKKGNLLTPLIVGGHQERGKRAGTENVPYIAGMAKAAGLAMGHLSDESGKVKYLRDKLEAGILKNVFNATLNSKAKHRMPNTTNIGFEYIEGELILLHLSDLGICASSGSACTSGSLEPSHVLKAMGTPFTCLHGSIRFSLSRYSTEKEVDYVLEHLPRVIDKIANISPFQKELAVLRREKI
ncbi:cysteine desulfurase [Candidatus Gastranaerophilus sp. (ex Termes propinquus)]|nr:cysteine desulfurase [Candidatus Gastranaerophilus sp. (ex Termes propinquus)]